MKGYRSSDLTLIAQPEGFFYELVTEALGRQRVKVQPETEFYVVKLLQQFIKIENLFSRDASGALKEEPLVILLKEALEEPHIEAQRIMLRRVGDVSLYMAGYFQDSLSRRLVDLDYYIDMGGAAYRQVAARVSEKPSQGVYEELAFRFSALVNVLSEVSDKTTPKTEKDLIRIYEKWITTGNDRAAKTLKEAGILPAQGKPKKNLQ